MRLPSFRDSRDVFVFLLTNFIDWCYRRKSLIYVDELTFYLKPEFTDVADESIILFKRLMESPSWPSLSLEDVTKLRTFYDMWEGDKSTSDYEYIFPSDSVESYSLTVLLAMGLNPSIVQRDGSYVTDMMGYISTQQWRILMDRRYDLSSPLHQNDTIDKLALCIHLDPDPTIITEEEFMEALSHSTKRNQRPGLGIEDHLVMVDNNSVTFQTLRNLKNALSRVYPDDDIDKLREYAYLQKRRRDVTRCLEGLNNLKRIRSSAGEDDEEMMENPSSPRLRGIETDPPPSSPRWEDLFDIMQSIGMTDIPPFRLSAQEYLRKKCLQIVLDTDSTWSWNTIITIADTFHVPMISTDKWKAVTLIQDTILLYFLKDDEWDRRDNEERGWLHLIEIGNAIGMLELSTNQDEVLNEIESFIMDAAFQKKWRLADD